MSHLLDQSFPNDHCNMPVGKAVIEDPLTFKAEGKICLDCNTGFLKIGRHVYMQEKGEGDWQHFECGGLLFESEYQDMQWMPGTHTGGGDTKLVAYLHCEKDDTFPSYPL